MYLSKKIKMKRNKYTCFDIQDYKNIFHLAQHDNTSIVVQINRKKFQCVRARNSILFEGGWVGGRGPRS